MITSVIRANSEMEIKIRLVVKNNKKIDKLCGMWASI